MEGVLVKEKSSFGGGGWGGGGEGAEYVFYECAPDKSLLV